MKKKILLVFGLLIVLSTLLYAAVGMKQKRQQQTPEPTPTPIASCPNITITDPTAEETITAPFTVTAIVDNTKSKSCHWTVFEAQAGTMKLIDSSGKIIGTGTLTTTEEWMTDEAVKYTGTLEFKQTPTNSDLLLTITEEDPSGQGGQTVTLPLKY